MSDKIVFMGTPEFSVPTLKLLVKSSFKVEYVYTQPPKKSLRGQKVNPSPVQKAARELNIKVRNPVSLRKKEEYEFFKSLSPKIVIVVAYGQIIPKNFLNLSDKGFINLHPSILPKWRGAAPIQRSIMNSDKETGISIMKITEDLDAGPYMKQVKVNIDEQTNAKILSEKLSKLGAQTIVECINLINKNKYKFINQNHGKATYAEKIKKSESKIDWNNCAKNILAKINALNPHPGAWFEYSGERYKIFKAVIKENNRGLPGEVINDELTVRCGDKSIQILEIQKQGKSRLSLEKFLIGNKISLGKKLI